MPHVGPSLGGVASGWTTSTNSLSSTDAGASALTGLPAAGATSALLLVDTFGLAVPVGAMIVGIQVVVDYDRRVPAIAIMNGQGLLNCFLTKDGGATWNAGETQPMAAQDFQIGTFGSASDMQGITLTPAQANSANFGVGISMTNDPGNPLNPAPPTMKIDFVTVTVFYTVAGSAVAVNFQSVTIPPYAMRF